MSRYSALSAGLGWISEAEKTANFEASANNWFCLGFAAVNLPKDKPLG